MIEKIPGDQPVTVGADKPTTTKDSSKRRGTMTALRTWRKTMRAARAQLDETASWLRGQPTEAQAGGRNLRLDEDGRRHEKTAASRAAVSGVDVYCGIRTM